MNLIRIKAQLETEHPESANVEGWVLDTKPPKGDGRDITGYVLFLARDTGRLEWVFTSRVRVDVKEYMLDYSLKNLRRRY